MKTYRVAIVGLGRMGSTLDQSIASASHVSERLQVVAGAETIPERRTAFQEKWGIETVYEDYQEMIEKEQPDLVAVCTTATGLPSRAIVRHQPPFGMMHMQIWRFTRRTPVYRCSLWKRQSLVPYRRLMKSLKPAADTAHRSTPVY